MEKTEEVETKEKAKSGDSAVMGEQKGKGPKNSKESIFHSYLLKGQWRDRGLRPLCFGMALEYQQLDIPTELD